MTAHSTNSDEYGYGRGGYGHGGYGHPHDDEEPSIDPEPEPDPTPIPEPNPDPSMPDNDPIRVTAEVTPEDEWPITEPRSDEEIREIVRGMDLGSGSSDIDPERLEAAENRLDSLEEEIRGLNTDAGVSEPRVEELESAVEHLAHVVEQLQAQAPSSGGDGEGFPPELLDEFEERAAEFRFPSRILNDVNPQDHPGRYHPVDHWGLDFEVTRPCHIRSAVVDAEETGTFTAVLNRYLNEDEEIEVVDSTEVVVEEAGEPVQVDLGLDVPEPGRYHLTRDGEFPLWRGEYTNWDEHFVDGMKVNTGAKPDSLREGGYNDEDYWYYYHALECTASENHEFER